VKILGRPVEAARAFLRLLERAKEVLGVSSAPGKCSAFWTGDDASEATPDLIKALDMLPSSIAGVETRLDTDKCLGIILDTGSSEAIAATKRQIGEKLGKKATVMRRLRDVVKDPTIAEELLRACIASRPGHWVRLQRPELTHEACKEWDAELIATARDIIGTLPQHSETLQTLPADLGGEGLLLATDARPSSFLSTWHKAWPRIRAACPQALQGLDTEEAMSQSALPFVVSIREAEAETLNDAQYINQNREAIIVSLPDKAAGKAEAVETTKIGAQKPGSENSSKLSSIPLAGFKPSLPQTSLLRPP